MEQTRTYFYHSHDKLLVTNEYTVLDGTLSLALSTVKGQSLQAAISDNDLVWKTFDADQQLWFNSIAICTGADQEVQDTLQKILSTATALNPNFEQKYRCSNVTAQLEFSRLWDLSSSSTLINNIAQWAEVSPYELLFESFGGSGCGITCAKASTPILYQLREGRPYSYPLQLLFPHTNRIYFVYLNQKQNNKEDIKRYRTVTKNKARLAESITKITEQLISAQTISDLCTPLDKHEATIGQYLGIPIVKERLLTDFRGAIKSLGAWDGDFVLAISETEDIPTYFASKGYPVCTSYAEMII